jgi:electron transport complex protein RnfB
MPITAIEALVFMGVLTGCITLALSFAAAKLGSNSDSAVEQVNRLLPQTQCGQCGYAGCRPYAEAIVNGAAELNQCPPGGESTIFALSEMLNRPALPPDPKFGEHQPSMVAIIDEDACIGCALCLQACPVDAILGAHQFMHTVIATECTGCELCIPPCPVDCIELSATAREPSRAYETADGI